MRTGEKFTFAEVIIYGMNIPGLHESSGGGIYDKMINDSLVSSGKASLKVVPPARAENNFASCTNCCMSPANLNPDFYDYGPEVIETEPMGIAKVHIFSPPGAPAVSSLSDLKGKKIGIRNGMPYGKAFEAAGLKTSAATDLAKNI